MKMPNAEPSPQHQVNAIYITHDDAHAPIPYHAKLTMQKENFVRKEGLGERG